MKLWVLYASVLNIHSCEMRPGALVKNESVLNGNNEAMPLEFRPLTESLAKLCNRLSLRQKDPNALEGGTEITCQPTQPLQKPVVLQIAAQLPGDQRDPLQTPWTLSRLKENPGEKPTATQLVPENVVLLEGVFKVNPQGQVIPVVQKVSQEQLQGFDGTTMASLLFAEFARVRDLVGRGVSGLAGVSVPCTLHPCTSTKSLAQISIMSLVASTLQVQEAQGALRGGDANSFYTNATGSLRSFVYSVKVAGLALNRVCLWARSEKR